VLLADIAIATPDTVFQDKAALRLRHRTGRRHPFTLAGVSSASIRGRTFVLTQQMLDAEEAKTLA